MRISDWSSDVCSSDLSGDNRLIPPKSSYRRWCLAPRCRLISSWGCSRSQGYGCSPFKEVRELGLKRRETVWSLYAVGVGYLTEPAPSTRGPERSEARRVGKGGGSTGRSRCWPLH